jgi:hypothetical protein
MDPHVEELLATLRQSAIDLKADGPGGLFYDDGVACEKAVTALRTAQERIDRVAALDKKWRSRHNGVSGTDDFHLGCATICDCAADLRAALSTEAPKGETK